MIGSTRFCNTHDSKANISKCRKTDLENNTIRVLVFACCPVAPFCPYPSPVMFAVLIPYRLCRRHVLFEAVALNPRYSSLTQA
jgi:hypothetical protein